MNLSYKSKLGKPPTGSIIKKVPFFACLSDEELSALEQIIKKRSFHKNEIILMEENTAHFMYVVYCGKVKVVQLSDKGREHILAFHKRGDYFGEMALLDGKTIPATVVAMENTEIGLLSRNQFDRYLLQNNKVAQQIIMMLCARLRESWLMLRVMSLADAEQRVRAVIDQMSRLYGVKDQRGTIIALRLTHKDIADHASVARETVTRLFKKFTREDEIEVLDNRYLLVKPSFNRKSDFL